MVIQKIELLLGRARTIPNAPRTIDLDILTYSDICINEEGLCLPHPRISERNFVLVPLKEIAPLVAAKFSKIKPKIKTKVSPRAKSVPKPKNKSKTKPKTKSSARLKRKKKS